MKRQAITASILTLALLVTPLGGWNVKVRAEGEWSYVQGDMTGVYQFGDFPSGENELAVCSDDQNVGYADGVQEYLYQQMKMRSGAIDVSSYRIKNESIIDLVIGVLNDHPDLYFVEQSWGTFSDGDFVRSVMMRYSSQYDDAAFEREASLALAVVKPGMSDLEKIIALHDYLAVNCRYADEFVGNVYSAYGALVDHTAVCQGYALAYQYLLHRAGVECYMVSSDKMNHVWNLVVLDGQYYHVDVTWDDPRKDLTGRACHEYMLKSDAELKDHFGWVMAGGLGDQQNYEATSTLYDNAFWNDSDAPMVIQGADCYYIAERGIMRASLSNINDAGTLIGDIGKWPGWGSSYFYAKKYSGLFENGNRLYYNDKGAIYSIALDGSDRRTEFTADTTDGYIYGSALCRGKVLYELKQYPQSSGQILTAELSGIVVPTPAPTAEPGPTTAPTPSPTATPKPTAAPTPSPMVTPKPTAAPTPSPTATPKPTAAPTPSPTEPPKPTAAPTPAPTEAPKPTAAPTPSPTATPKPSPTSTPDPVTPPSDDVTGQVRSFVSRMYTVVLGRDAEEKGLKDWTERLLSHEVDGAGIAHGFIMSGEFQNRNLSNGEFVDVLYRTFFNREADAGGRANWMAALAAGKTRGYVLSGFVNSTEFDKLCDSYGIARGTMQEDGTPCNPGIRSFVERCYTKVLGRAGEKAGIEEWTNRISTGQMSAEDVAKSFFFSDEYIDKKTNNETFVETLYQTFMDRASDPAGKSDWVGRLNSGTSRREVLEGFSRSTEFTGILQSFGL